MSAKKVKVKVKKKKVNPKKIIVTIFIFLILIITVIYVSTLPIKNIYITGNDIVSDKDIIKLASLENYPSFITTLVDNIEEKILKNEYIKSVKVKHKLFGKIYIEVEEYKPLCIYQNKLVLSSSKKIENTYKIDYVPYITNNIDTIYDEFIKKFKEVNYDTLLKISHIEYAPNEVDEQRFLLYMIDDNYVYITLPKIEKINKYNSIIKELDNKKGIIYLDLGDYVEVKKTDNSTTDDNDNE